MTPRTVGVIGGGIIGRAVSLACLDRGLAVTLFDTREPGESSPAGAGMLAPAMEADGSPAERLCIVGRDLWPAYLSKLSHRSSVHVALNRDGILALAHDEAERARRVGQADSDTEWIDPARDAQRLVALEPGLRAPFGARLLRFDGAVDNVALLAALDDVLSRARGLTRAGPARGLARIVAGVRVECTDGAAHDVDTAVVANGAWAPRLRGLPRSLAVEPVRGEMLGFPVAAARHAIYGPGAYVVPRPGGRIIVGATMDRVGFDAATTDSARRALHAAVARFLPALSEVEPDSHWAGLRPVTPDGLPILGPDPLWPAVIHATGHSRNGILLAPLTAQVVSAWASGEEPGLDLSPFDPVRFG